MNMDATQTGTVYTGGASENVVSFAGYIARNGRKSTYQYNGPETNLVQLSGCDVIDLSDRRS